MGRFSYLGRADWVAVGCGAAASFNFAQVLLQPEAWMRALALAAFTGLVVVVVSRLTIRRVLAMQREVDATIAALIPTNIALQLNEDGTASAFVKTESGLNAISIPEEIAEQGPQACIAYVADVTGNEIRRELGLDDD